MATYKIAWKAQ